MQHTDFFDTIITTSQNVTGNDRENDMNKNETAVLEAFNEGAFAEGGDFKQDEWGIEQEHVVETIKNVLDVKQATAKGVVTSLTKKEIFKVDDLEDGPWVTLTDKGKTTILDLDMELDDEDIPEPKVEKTKPKVSEKSKAAAKADAAKTPMRRTSHADCTHAKSGPEGKKARAACRRERAKEKANA